MKEVGTKPGSVDDIVASVEDAVRRAYALGRSDAMKRVVELAQADDPGLRAVALLGPAEPSRREAVPASLESPAEPAPATDQAPADAAPAQHAELHETAHAEPPGSSASQQAASAEETPRDPPRSVGGFLADYFYPLGSKK